MLQTACDAALAAGPCDVHIAEHMLRGKVLPCFTYGAVKFPEAHNNTTSPLPGTCYCYGCCHST